MNGMNENRIFCVSKYVYCCNFTFIFIFTYYLWDNMSELQYVRWNISLCSKYACCTILKNLRERILRKNIRSSLDIKGFTNLNWLISGKIIPNLFTICWSQTTQYFLWCACECPDWFSSSQKSHNSTLFPQYIWIMLCNFLRIIEMD